MLNQIIILFLIATSSFHYGLFKTDNAPEVELTLVFQNTHKVGAKVFCRITSADGLVIDELIIDGQTPQTIKTLKLKSGRYAVSSFYDENGNGKLDTNYFGVPAEKYGFSNGVRGSVLGPPSLASQLVTLKGNATLNIPLE